MSVGQGLVRVMFKHGAEPCLGPARERGEVAPPTEGPRNVEFPSLEVRPWVRACGWGLGPAWLEGLSEGVSECRGRALGGGVGAGLGLCAAGGRLRGKRIRPGSSPVPKCTGKTLARFPSIPPRPPPLVSPRMSPIPAGPLTVGGPHWV